MNDIKMKNMVVLKDLPSNIVEEAFVVFKTTKKAKKLEKIEQNKTSQSNNTSNKNKEYFLKEAEMLVNDYINKIEKNDSKKSTKSKQISNRVKMWAYISTGIAIAEWIILINS